MIIDSHAHVFSSKIIANVSAKQALVKKLHLQAKDAARRSSVAALREDCSSSGVKACLVLPTANVSEVVRINSAFMEMAAAADFLFTAGTLHPYCDASREELLRLRSQGVRAIKLCSFSQEFPLLGKEAGLLFRQIEEVNAYHGGRFFVVLDTFYLAHEFFGTPVEHTTTPAMLGEIVKAYRGVNFLAAHMGGLAAPPEEIFKHLAPSINLYLDTSNAAHTLPKRDFLRLLDRHGPGRVLFGTDWPWFEHRGEAEKIDGLLDEAGCGTEEKNRVFYGNIAALLGIETRCA